MPKKHAYLSASSAYRWMECPPIRQFEILHKEKTSSYAKEGTDAHSLAEYKLRTLNGETLDKEALIESLDYYDQEMEEATDYYRDLIEEKLNSYEDAFLDVEAQVDYSPWVPEGFGTSDAVIVTPKVIEVIDFKYGKGVPVSAYLNPQLMLYGLGAYNLYSFIYDFEKVKFTIVQPRIDNVSSHELETPELLYWADNYVYPRAMEAYEGTGEWNFTKDTTRFSSVRAVARPRADGNFKVIKRFGEKKPFELSLEELSEILDQAPEIESWLSDVKSYTLGQAMEGQSIPHYKVVEGRSVRKITNEAVVASRLKEEGFEEKDFIKPPQLETIGKLEKLVGKAHFAELAEDCISKTTGKPTLVPETDKRPEIGSTTSAQDDFKDL